MVGPYRIRPAAAADVPVVAAIERRVFSDPWSPGMIRSGLDDLALVAEGEGGAVLGYAVARAMPPAGEILNLAVVPEARGGGIGVALTRVIVRALVGAGCREVFLEVRASNRAARALYEKLGFRRVGVRPGYYRRPREDAHVLVLRVESCGGPA